MSFSLQRKNLARKFYYKRYVDDIYVLFNSAENLKRIQRYLNSRHVNISFTIENEKDNRMSFVDVNIILEQENLKTSVYRKPTFFAEFILPLTVSYHASTKLT